MDQDTTNAGGKEAKEAAPASPVMRKAAPGDKNTPCSTVPGKRNPPPREPQWSDFFSSPLFLIIVVIWIWVFFSARKHKQKEAKRKEELQALSKGDKVITVGGMHGTVVGLSEKTMTLKPDDKHPVTITLDRVALLKKLTPGGQGNKDKAS